MARDFGADDLRENDSITTVVTTMAANGKTPLIGLDNITAHGDRTGVGGCITISAMTGSPGRGVMVRHRGKMPVIL